MNVSTTKEAGQVLGLRRSTPTRGEQISSELGEARDHLREVASLLAGSAAERFAPRVEQAKDMVSPRMEKARGAALHGLENMTVALGGQKPRPRWPMLLAALSLGLAAGAVGALVMQRRNARWDEYEPVTVLGMDDNFEDETAEVRAAAKHKAHDVKETAKTAASEVRDTVKTAASEVKDTVKNAAEQLRN